MPFHFINQLDTWHRLSGSRVLFVVITFTQSHVVSLATSEKSCRFNSSYAMSIYSRRLRYSFLEDQQHCRSCTCDGKFPVSADSYFLQKSSLDPRPNRRTSVLKKCLGKCLEHWNAAVGVDEGKNFSLTFIFISSKFLAMVYLHYQW